MDTKPFFEIDMLDLNDQNILYLANFMKTNLDIDNILNSASDLKYVSLTKTVFKDIIENPTDEFVKLLLSFGIYDGMKNQKTIEKFRPIIKRGINQFINEKMSSKFKETLNNTEKEDVRDTEYEEDKVITTFDELNGFAIVKSILRKHVESSRIAYRDTESYFGVLLDDNNRKWICRLNLDSKNRHIIISDQNKNGIRYNLNTLDDIYELEEQLKSSLQKYL